MLIAGSSGSSGGLVGEHQPDEPMRDGGRPAGRRGRDERDEGLAGGRAHAWVRMAQGRRWDYIVVHGEQGGAAVMSEMKVSRGRRRDDIAVQAEQGAVAGRQD